MNFYTSELQEVINQLSQSGIHGYWETLGLILKLLGLLAGPIAGITAIVVIRFVVPFFVSNCYVTKERLAKSTWIKIDVDDKSISLRHLDSLNKNVTRIYFISVAILSAISTIFFSPFLFISEKGPIRVLVFALLLFYLLIPVLEYMDRFYMRSIIKEILYIDVKSYRDLRDEIHQFYKNLDKETKKDEKRLKECMETAFAGRVSKVVVK